MRCRIGKAHIVGQDVQATSYWPPESTPEVHSSTSGGAAGEGVKGEEANGKLPWVLVNSTPATCAQIGISHFFQERGPIELVVSGPNYGRYGFSDMGLGESDAFQGALRRDDLIRPRQVL